MQLVEKGIIQSLSLIFKVNDVKMLAVALEGIDNILECGDKHFLDADGENNQFAQIMETDGCIDDLENL